MQLIDTHCHLTSDSLHRQFEQVCRRAWDAGVERMITVATSAMDSRRTIALAGNNHRIHATIGIHPHEAGQVEPGDWQVLRELRHNAHVVAWGEIGLDYHYDFSPRDRQREVFLRQLDLLRSGPTAAPRALPVIIHCRDAVDDIVHLLASQGLAGHAVVFHCFTGTADEARAILAHGWWLSFTGIVTFKNSLALQAIAADYPLDRLMVETDAPYLSPVPKRHVKPNEPALLPHTAAFLADLRGLPLADFAAQTSANARRFFALPGGSQEVPFLARG